MMRHSFLFMTLLMAVCVLTTRAQEAQRTIQGTVTDENREPAIGATVVVTAHKT